MKKRIISIVLCLLMITSFVIPTTVSAATSTINYLSFSGIRTPKGGDDFDGSRYTDFTITTNPAGGATIDAVIWYDKTANKTLDDGGNYFEQGHIYMLELCISANNNYEFKTNSQGELAITPYVSIPGITDAKFTVGTYNNRPLSEKLSLSYIFPPCDSVSQVQFNLDLPVEGEHPNYNLVRTGLVNPYTDRDGEYDGYTVKNGIAWWDDIEENWISADEVFNPTHSYYVSVYIKPYDGYVFYIDDKGNPVIDVSFNGITDSDKIYIYKVKGMDPTQVLMIQCKMDMHIHTPGDWAVINQPTCDKAGTRARYCTECKKQVASEEIPALGHDLSDWTITVSPDCQADGEEIRTCKRENCTYRETRVIPKIDHTYNEGVVIKAATDEEDGVMLYTCTMCGETREEVIPKLPKNDISHCTFEGDTNYTYTGNCIVPVFTIKNGETALEEYKDYLVTTEGDDKNVGTFKMTVTGMGSYSGSFTKVITIAPITLSSVAISKNSYTYNGKVIHPSPTVKAVVKGETVNVSSTDYTVTYSKDCKNVGNYVVKVIGKGNYTGTANTGFKIVKAKNPMTVKAVTKSVKLSKVKKAKQTVKGAVTVKNVQGTVAYAKVAKGSYKKLTISKKGVITVAKGTKKGTHNIKVKVTTKGNKNYKSLSKTITVSVKVK